jgi:glucan phosphoethanolaminetransferase (alkaline phosphatase superfamily)
MQLDADRSKKYRPSKRWYLPISMGLGFMLLVLIYSIFKYPSMNSSLWNISIDIFLAVTFLFYMLFPVFGMFVTLENKRLSRTDYFFLRKSLSVDGIKDIEYKPTFIAGKINRTLTITANHDNTSKQITMSYPTFTEDTLANIITDLKNINASIRISEEARALLER